MAVQLDSATEELKRSLADDPNAGCETVFQTYPDLWNDRDSALELIYLEYVFRQERNDEGEARRTIDDYVRRFPQYRDDIIALLQIDEAMGSMQSLHDASTRHSTGSHSSIRTGSDVVSLDDPMPEDPTVSIGKLAHGSVRPTDPRRADWQGLGQIGAYQLIEVLGHGGMGVVYRAVQQGLSRSVAVKTIHESHLADRSVVARIQREAELASSLQHPNIVQIFEVGTDHGKPYISMEYIPGGSLAQAVRERPLKAEVAADLVASLARAAEYAHQRHVLHRDLKPGNVLLVPSQRPEALEIPQARIDSSDGAEDRNLRFEPKIVDFGLAIQFEAMEANTRSHHIAGTPSYMAPEQIDSSVGAIGAASDIYALGAILFHILGGRPPFVGATMRETLRQVLEDEPISLRELQPRIPLDLDSICRKCLRKNPTARYGSASELADDLERFLKGVPVRAKPTTPWESAYKWSRRHPSLCGLLVAMISAFALVTWLWRHSERSLEAEILANERSSQLVYARNIALANTEYRANNVDRSIDLLDRCSPEYRHWEWTYLQNLCQEPIWRSPDLGKAVTCGDLSRDGRYVAVGFGRWGENSEQFVDVFDRISSTRIASLPAQVNGSVRSVKFSPDGTRLLTSAMIWEGATSPGQVIEWDFLTGTATRVLTEKTAKTATYSPNGSSIFVGCTDGTILVFNAVDGSLRQEWKDNGGFLHSLSVSSDGRYLASSSQKGVVGVWDIAENRRVQKLQGMGDTRHVAWSPDGGTLLASEFSGLIRTFEFDSEVLRLVKPEMRSKTPTLCYSPDGLTLATAVFREGADLRDADTGRVLRNMRSHHGHVQVMAFDALGNLLMTAGADGKACVWDLSDRNPHSSERVGTGGGIACAEDRPGTSQFAIGIKRLLTQGTATSGKPRIEVFDSPSMKLVRSYFGHADWITSVSFDPVGRLMVSGSLDRTVRVWDPDLEDALHVLPAQSGPVVGAWIDASGECVWSVDDRGSIQQWDLGKQTAVWSTGIAIEATTDTPSVTAAAYSYATHRLAIAVASKKEVQVWDLHQRRMIGSIPLSSNVLAMAFHPAGYRLAIAADQPVIEMWDTNGIQQTKPQEPEFTMRGHSNAITSLSFSRDGKRLVSVGRDETVRLFETSRGFELMILAELSGSDSVVSFVGEDQHILRCEGRKMFLWSIDRVSERGSTENERLLGWHREGYSQANMKSDRYGCEFHLSRLMELEPANPIHWVHRGRVRMLHGEFGDAEVDLATARSMRDDLTVGALMARNYLAMGDLDGYRQTCQRLVGFLSAATSQNDVNTIAWTCVLHPASEVELVPLAERMEKICEEANVGYYWNTVSLLHYRLHQDSKAIRASAKSLEVDRVQSEPLDWMIRSMTYARKLTQGGGQRAKILELLQKDLKRIENWKEIQAQRVGIDLRIEARLLPLYRVELPQLEQELGSLLEAIGLDR
jgi:WD40 repeat protein/serine/threonine protein kinase/tetratricopeptide (TPR) repeat protein